MLINAKKTTKIIYTTLICVLFACAALTFTLVYENANADEVKYAFNGKGTADSPFLIKTAKDLYKMDEVCNSDAFYLSAYYLLESDVTLNTGTFAVSPQNFLEYARPSESTVWTPIGSDDSPFCGTFDGGRHTISGLYVLNESSAAMFGANNGTIKNLTLNNSLTNGASAAIIAATNCVDGIIDSVATVDGAVLSSTLGGGIVCANHGVIVNVLNDAPIYVASGIGGGIAGLNDGRIMNFCNAAKMFNQTDECVSAGVCGVQNAGGVIIGGYSNAVFNYKGTKFGLVAEYNASSLVRSAYWFKNVNMNSFQSANDTERLKHCACFRENLTFSYFDADDEVTIFVKVGTSEFSDLKSALDTCTKYYSSTTFDAYGEQISATDYPALKRWSTPEINVNGFEYLPKPYYDDYYTVSGYASDAKVYAKTITAEAFYVNGLIYENGIADFSALHKEVSGNVVIDFDNYFVTQKIKFTNGEYTLYGNLYLTDGKKQILSDDTAVIHSENCKIGKTIPGFSDDVRGSGPWGYIIFLAIVSIIVFSVGIRFSIKRKQITKYDAKTYSLAFLPLFAAISALGITALLISMHFVLVASVVFAVLQRNSYIKALTKHSLKNLDPDFNGYFDFSTKITTENTPINTPDGFVTVLSDNGAKISGNVSSNSTEQEIDPENPFKNFSFDFPDFNEPPKPLEEPEPDPNQMTEEELAELRANLRAGLADVLGKHNNNN